MDEKEGEKIGRRKRKQEEHSKKFKERKMDEGEKTEGKEG